MIDKVRSADDSEIIGKILSGDKELYRVIIERYEKIIYSIGMRFFRNEDEAMDFCQEVFVKAYTGLSGYRGLAPFKFWLFKIAYNHGINRTASLKKNAGGELLSQYLQSAEPGPETQFSSREIRRVLADAMDELKSQYKVCVDLYFFLGFSYPEISIITGIPVNTIKSNVLRAREILRRNLKGTIAEYYHEM